jgi:hypothetical protein
MFQPRSISGAVLVLCAIFLFCPSCTSKEKEQESKGTVGARTPWNRDGLVNLLLEADSTLLGVGCEDTTLGIRLAPPRGWTPLGAEIVDQTRATLGQIVSERDPLHSRPVRVFSDEDQRRFMILAEFHNWPISEDLLASMGDYRARVEALMGGSEIEERTYLLGEITVYQLLITNQIIANRRLILIRLGRKPVQIDYLMPSGLYLDLAKSIEASIGSIAPL